MSIRRLTRVLLFLLLLTVLVQWIPVARDNPPVTAEIEAPEELMKILRRSCYDCHSHETIWPWYSYVAPFSWLVAHDVHHGREELNFSTWGGLSQKKKAKMKDEIREKVSEGEMPLWIYLLAHPEAKPGDADKAVIRSWSLGSGD